MEEYYLEPDAQEESSQYVLEPETVKEKTVPKKKSSFIQGALKTLEGISGEPSAAAARNVIRATMKETSGGGKMSPYAALGPLAGYAALASKDEKVLAAAEQGFFDPSSVETFQVEAIRKATEPYTTEWSQRKGIFSPENKFGRFLIGAESFVRGIIPTGVGLAQDMAVNPVDTAANIGSLIFPSTAVAKPVQEQVASNIDDTVKHVTKVRSSGIRTRSQLISQTNKMKGAIGDVVDNIDNVKLKSGNQYPVDVNDLLDATEQTKQQIYTAYDGFKKEAGQAGVVLDKNEISQELLKKYSRESLNVTSPSTKKAAQEITLELNSIGDITPEVAQQMIEDLNQQLKTFYKSGAASFGDIGSSNVKASFAQILREKLDNAIMKETGKGYQVFKNKYGALAELESQMTKRVLSVAQKNKASIFDVIDVISAGQIFQGVATGNPALAFRGGIQAVGKKFLKELDNPNRIVNDLFSKAYTIKSSKPFAPIAGQSAVRAFVPETRILSEQNKLREQ